MECLFTDVREGAPGLEYGPPVYARIGFDKAKLDRLIAAMAERKRPHASDGEFRYELCYVPYYLIRVRGTKPRRFRPPLIRCACFGIEAVSGYYAATPGLLPNADMQEENIREGARFPVRIPVEEALQKGMEALRENASFSVKGVFWCSRALEIRVEAIQFVYKPYWAVHLETPEGHVTRAIDAVTGELGGSNGYRFMQCYQNSRPMGSEL